MHAAALTDTLNKKEEKKDRIKQGHPHTCAEMLSAMLKWLNIEREPLQDSLVSVLESQQAVEPLERISLSL